MPWPCPRVSPTNPAGRRRRLARPVAAAAPAARAASAVSQPRADACILIFLNGGPSHLDMWDMKPDAPAEIRGEFKPIATTRARRPVLRAPAAAGPADAPLHADPLGAPQRQQRPRGGGLHRPDRPRPRRRQRRRSAPARTTTRPSARCWRMLRPPQTAVVPYVSHAVHHAGRRRRAAAAGLLRRLAGPQPTTRSSCSAIPTPPAFGMPELSPLPTTSARPPGRSPRPAQPRWNRRNARPRRCTTWTASSAKAFDLLTVAGHAARLPARPRAGRRPRPLRPQHLRPERAAGPPADRGRHARRLHLLGARRQRHLGHARQQLHEAEERAAAAARRGRVAACSTDLAERGMLERTLVAVMGEFGRTPEGQRQRAAATTGTSATRCCWPAAASSAGYVHGASDKHRRPAEPQPGHARRRHRHDLPLPGHLRRPGAARPPGPAVQLVPWGTPIREVMS